MWILQQLYEGQRQSKYIQAEQIATLVGSHLKQRHPVAYTFFKRRTSLCINTQQRELTEVPDGKVSLLRRIDDIYLPLVFYLRHFINLFLRYFVFNYHLLCEYQILPHARPSMC